MPKSISQKKKIGERTPALPRRTKKEVEIDFLGDRIKALERRRNLLLDNVQVSKERGDTPMITHYLKRIKETKQEIDKAEEELEKLQKEEY